MDPVYSSIGYLARGAMWLPKAMYGSIPAVMPVRGPDVVKVDAVFAIVKENLRPYIRLAAIVGGVSLTLSAYGAHSKLMNKSDSLFEKEAVIVNFFDRTKCKKVYETATKQQLFTAFALMGVGFSSFPVLTATLFVVGDTLFAGSCYYYALTGNNKFSALTPIGGVAQVIAWFLMAV